mgnify:CR=1 FL=1
MKDTPNRANAGKFIDPAVTAGGEPRASVALSHPQTLWFNTGSLCNITCQNCYMDSSPTNDRLAYMTIADVVPYLDEIEAESLPVKEIAFTGGEPFMNRDLPDMIEAALERGFGGLVLTNAMLPMLNKRLRLLEIFKRHGRALTLRISVDHFTNHFSGRVFSPTVNLLTEKVFSTKHLNCVFVVTCEKTVRKDH